MKRQWLFSVPMLKNPSSVLPESVLDKRLRLGYRAINKIWKVSEATMYFKAGEIVVLVKPTYRPGSMESFIKLMPEGVGFIPAHAGIRAGNEKELQDALTVAEKKVARLAELGADVVMIMGAPPTMVRGHGADRQIADSLTKKYKIPVTVATIAQVDAFRALGMKKLVGITYFQN